MAKRRDKLINSKIKAANVNAETATDGYVLTSDGAGNTAWEALPAVSAEANDLTAAVTWTNIPIANVPTGTSGTTVALGDHNHDGTYAKLSGNQTFAGHQRVQYTVTGEPSWNNYTVSVYAPVPGTGDKAVLNFHLGDVTSRNIWIQEDDPGYIKTDAPIKQSGALVWDAGDFSSSDVANWNSAYGWGNHASAGYITDLVNDTAPRLGANLDLNGFEISTTNHGNAGSMPLTFDGTTTTGDWSDLPMGFSAFIRHTAAHSPVANYGYFTKVSSRDSGGAGWGGLWVGYSADQNYVGRSQDGTSNEWEKIITTSTPNYAQWNTAYGWGDHAGLYEPADAAIVKSDEAETITAIWTWGANLDMGDYEIHSYALDFNNYWDEPTANTVQFNVSNCGMFFVDLDDPDLTGNITIDFTGYHATAKVHEFTVKIQQQTTGSRTVTWPTEVKWPGGTVPTMSTGADAVDIYHFLTHDGGTTVYGTFAQSFS